VPAKGSITIAPLVNITNDHGAQTPEKSVSVEKPNMATRTTTTPTAITTSTNGLCDPNGSLGLRLAA